MFQMVTDCHLKLNEKRNLDLVISQKNKSIGIYFVGNLLAFLCFPLS